MRKIFPAILTLLALAYPAHADECSITQLWNGSPFSSPAFLVKGYWVKDCKEDSNLQIVQREIGLTDVQNKALFSIPKNTTEEAFMKGAATVLDLYNPKTMVQWRRSFFFEKGTAQSTCDGKYELVSLSLQGRSSDEWSTPKVRTGLCMGASSQSADLLPVTVMDFTDNGEESLDLAIFSHLSSSVQGIHFDASTGKASLLFELPEENGSGVPRFLPGTEKIALFTLNSNDQVFFVDYSDSKNLKYEEKYRAEVPNPWRFRDSGPSYRDLRTMNVAWVEIYRQIHTLYYVTRRQLTSAYSPSEGNRKSEPWVIKLEY